MSEAPLRPWLFSARDLLVVDLEATCDAKDFPPDRMEIIEIGAVLVDTTNWAIHDEFQTFVRPREGPELTKFCRNLTGIRQADVDEAPDFPRSMRAFAEWYRPHGLEVWASWGVYDLVQFRRDMKRFGIPSPLPVRHLNLKSRYAERRARDGRRPGMRQALAAEGMTFEGRQHRGIDDARNLTRLLGPIFDD